VNTTYDFDLGNPTKIPEGDCSNFTNVNETSNIRMEWVNGSVTHKMTLQFKVGKDNSSWYFSKVGFTISFETVNGDIYGEKTFQDGANSDFLHAGKNTVYQCDRKEVLNLSNNFTVTISNIMVQPFTNNNTLSTNIDFCANKSEASKSSSIVPIAVGCALAGLIIIVLIAYLIGRRKNDGRGYQQV